MVAGPVISPAAEWHGPGAPDTPRDRFSWQAFLWWLVFPPRRHRIGLTVPGLFLMGLSVGIGTAAYNTASNILFLTLSLLLACLLLSGLLSWFNFTGVCWRLRPAGPWRVGHETMVTVEVENRKRWLPTYSLWFELATQPRIVLAPEELARELPMREILAGVDRFTVRGRLNLRERVEPAGAATLDWIVKPVRRGEALVELESVGSLFPFGFLRKNIGTGLRHTVTVWPEQVEYQWLAAPAAPSGVQGRRTARLGTGDDLLALRKYESGDSHRLIHWKASARLGQLMIRQFAAESHDGYLLRLDTPADLWRDAEQFELLCRFVATLAEDLYAAGRLRGLALNGEPLCETRRLRDLEAVLDGLATVQPRPAGPAGRKGNVSAFAPGLLRNVITFAPEGTRRVTAYVDGHPVATA